MGRVIGVNSVRSNISSIVHCSSVGTVGAGAVTVVVSLLTIKDGWHCRVQVEVDGLC